MLKNISLSICIPTYNRKNKLKRTLDVLVPVLDISSSIEIIVSDNCSLDGTSEIRRDYADKLRWNTNEANLGLLGNLRKLYSLAQGEFIWFVGDDDYVSPEALFSVLKVIEKNKVDHIFLNHEILSGGSLTNRVRVLLLSEDLIIDSNSFKLLELINENYICQLMFITANVYRKKSLVQFISDVDSIALPLYLTLSVMRNGNTYVLSDSHIINDWSDISWSDQYRELYTKEIPNIFYLAHSKNSLFKVGLGFRLRWVYKYKRLYGDCIGRAIGFICFVGAVN